MSQWGTCRSHADIWEDSWQEVPSLSWKYGWRKEVMKYLVSGRLCNFPLGFTGHPQFELQSLSSSALSSIILKWTPSCVFLWKLLPTLALETHCTQAWCGFLHHQNIQCIYKICVLITFPLLLVSLLLSQFNLLNFKIDWFFINYNEYWIVNMFSTNMSSP